MSLQRIRLNFQTMLCIVLNNDRRPLLQLRNKLISKTCQWHVFDTLYLYSYTKAATSLLLGIFSLAENPSFATRCEIHPLDALLRRVLRKTKASFCFQVGFRRLRAAPQGLCPQDPHQRGHCPLWKPMTLLIYCSLNYNLYKIYRKRC